MINTTVITIPAYTTREVRNFGLYNAKQFYKFRFTREDRALLLSKAIKLFPQSMCHFTVTRPCVLLGVKRDGGQTIDVSKFDEKILMTLLKTGVIGCELKPELKELDTEKVIKLAETYSLVGQTFKKVAETLGVEFETIKTAFELKQGGANKKITAEDITKLQELI